MSDHLVILKQARFHKLLDGVLTHAAALGRLAEAQHFWIRSGCFLAGNRVLPASCCDSRLIPTQTLSSAMPRLVEDCGYLPVTVFRGHFADDVQGLSGGLRGSGGLRLAKPNLGVAPALPVDDKMEHVGLGVERNRNLLDQQMEDLLLDFYRAVRIAPHLGEVVTKAANGRLGIGCQDRAFEPDRGDGFSNAISMLELCVPASFQLTRNQAVSRVNLVVLFEGPLHLKVQLFQLGLQRPLTILLP